MKKLIVISVVILCLISACSYNSVEARARQGDASAQVLFASTIEIPESAFYWYEQAALQGHSDGQNNLGILYQKGQGVKQDYELAFHWFMKSAEQNNVTAQYNLGNLYQRGLGVAQDYNQAMQWYKKAAAGGIIMARLQIAEMYYEGAGVRKDIQQSYVWAALAALKGDVHAEKLRNKTASLLNVEELVAAQKMATELNQQFKGIAL